jgi:hypothetical protein
MLPRQVQIMGLEFGADRLKTEMIEMGNVAWSCKIWLSAIWWVLHHVGVSRTPENAHGSWEC